MPLNNFKWIQNGFNIIYKGNKAWTELVMAVKWKTLNSRHARQTQLLFMSINVSKHYFICALLLYVLDSALKKDQ